MPTTTTTAEPRPRTRGKGRMNVAIKDAIEAAFGRANRGGRYLEWLAAEHPAVFVNLVCRCLPQSIQVDVHNHAVNLGLEMRLAAETLARLNHPPMIDVTPDTDTPDTPDTDKVAPVTTQVTPDTPDKVAPVTTQVTGDGVPPVTTQVTGEPGDGDGEPGDGEA
jgi:hypothetical protein